MTVTNQDIDAKVTINDVASAAGVAASTVSRSFSAPEKVSERTRERIRRIAESMNYTPHAQARGLASGKTGNIALLVPDIANPFLTDIVRGSQSQLSAAGYVQMLVDTQESADVELAMIRKLGRSVDGVVLTATRLDDEQLIQIAGQLPLVTINRPVEGIASAVIDTPSGIVQCVEHLVSLGHKRIAYVAGPKSSWSSARRWDAIQDAASRLNVEVVTTRAFTPGMSSGAAAVDAILNLDVTGCIVFNDLLAIGMLEALRERNVRVPEDISVVGCDDSFGASFCQPPLTTLAGQAERAGRSAVSLLLIQLEFTGQRPHRTTLLDTHLVVRQSTGLVRTGPRA